MGRPSTRNLSALPAPSKLERLCRSLATLDAILSPDWEYRYYSFDKHWDTAKNHRMASMRNGSGGDYYILFAPQATVIKGYAHEYPMASPGRPPEGVLSSFPPTIKDFLTEPAFTMEDTTFCTWCLPDGEWEIGPIQFPDHDDPDGSGFLLEILGETSRAYSQFARDYFETDVPVEALEAILTHQPLTAELIAKINSDASLEGLADDIEQIGYPVDQ